MENKFSIDWPHGHITRDGRKARIICTDVNYTAAPIVALVPVFGDSERAFMFASDGRYIDGSSNADLINAPAPDWEKIAGAYRDALSKIKSTVLESSVASSFLARIIQITDAALSDHANAFKAKE